MKYKLFEFVGSPGAGKTTLSKKISEKLMITNENIFLFSAESVHSSKAKKITLFDRLVTIFVFIKIILYTLSKIHLGNDYSIKEWYSWLKRLHNEWINCIANRRYLQENCLDYEIVISDSRILGKLIFEISDPRNIVGIKLIDLLIANLHFLIPPTIIIEHLIVISANSDEAENRTFSRTFNKVRTFLSEEKRNIFFNNADELSDILLQKSSIYNVRRISKINTTNLSIEESCDRLSSVLQL